MLSDDALLTLTKFKTVAVTGGAGFLGYHLCRAYLEDGARVICLDNLSSPRTDTLEQLAEFARFEFVRCDVTKPFDLPGDTDLVLHFASLASPLSYQAMPVETLLAGSAGTFNALLAAERSGARFVYASTSEVYGDPLEHPQSESYWGNVDPIGPRSVYDESKRYGEALTMAFVRRRRVDAAVVRLFNTFGPQMSAVDGRLVPTMIRQALKGEPLTVFGTGRQSRSLCFVSDTVQGVRMVAASRLQCPVNIGATDERTVLEVAQLIRTACSSTSVIAFESAADGDPKVRRPDTARIHAALGWHARVPLEDGIDRTVAWCRSRPEYCA